MHQELHQVKKIFDTEIAEFVLTNNEGMRGALSFKTGKVSKIHSRIKHGESLVVISGQTYLVAGYGGVGNVKCKIDTRQKLKRPEIGPSLGRRLGIKDAGKIRDLQTLPMAVIFQGLNFRCQIKQRQSLMDTANNNTY